MNHMKFTRSLLLLLLAVLISATTFAQSRKGERIHALKVSFITNKMELSSDQAERFWPVYNKYEQDVRTTRKQYLTQGKARNRKMTDAEARQYVENNLDFQEAVIDLKRRYKEQFLKVISAQQLANLYTAEREFKQMLIQKLRDKKRK